MLRHGMEMGCGEMGRGVVNCLRKLKRIDPFDIACPHCPEFI